MSKPEGKACKFHWLVSASRGRQANRKHSIASTACGGAYTPFNRLRDTPLRWPERETTGGYFSGIGAPRKLGISKKQSSVESSPIPRGNSGLVSGDRAVRRWAQGIHEIQVSGFINIPAVLQHEFRGMAAEFLPKLRIFYHQEYCIG